MKCNQCGSEWKTPPAIQKTLKACPFCGEPLPRSRRNLGPLAAGVADVLEELGLENLSRGPLLMGTFLDLAPERKREQQMLRLLVEMNGHTALIQALSLSQGEQKTAIERLVYELRTQRFMDEKIARSICVAFFQGIGGSVPEQPGPTPQQCTRPLQEQLTMVRERSEVIEQHLITSIDDTIVIHSSGDVSVIGKPSGNENRVPLCSSWKSISRLYGAIRSPFSGNEVFCIGVTRSGQVLHTSASASDKILREMSHWTDIRKLHFSAYWNGQTVYGIRKDGSVVSASAAEPSRPVAHLRKVERIVCRSFAGEVVWLSTDGALDTKATDYNQFPCFRQSEWLHLKDAFYLPVSSSDKQRDFDQSTGRIVGLRENGRLVSSDYVGEGTDATGWEEASSWSDLVQVFPLEGGRIVGLRSDGRPLITHAGITPEQEVQPLFAIEQWRNVAKLYRNNGRLIGLCGDGRVLVTERSKQQRKVKDYPEAMALSGWTDVVALQFGFRYTLGVKRDGSFLATRLKPEYDDGQADAKVLNATGPMFQDYEKLMHEYQC